MDITVIIFVYLVIVLSAVIHEYAHALMAYRLGDNTAKDMGRLTLNPFAHLDPLGTVMLPLIFLFLNVGFFGWAKPVPYNPYNLSDRKYGSLKVGLAGPGSNLVIALILGLFIRFSGAYGIYGGDPSGLFLQLLSFVVFTNIFLALFNLIPIPPLDGSKVLMDLFPRQAHQIEQIGIAGIFIAVFIAMYALEPVANGIFWAITGSRF